MLLAEYTRCARGENYYRIKPQQLEVGFLLGSLVLYQNDRREHHNNGNQPYDRELFTQHDYSPKAGKHDVSDGGKDIDHRYQPIQIL